MSTITREFTKEQLQQIIETDHVQCGEASSLARIALASLEAVPVGTFKKGPCGYHPSFHEDAVPLYTAPPSPVAVPDIATVETTYPDVQTNWHDAKMYAEGWNACRAAMLQSFGNSEQLNSPVIPDGWVACSERMPEVGEIVLTSDGTSVKVGESERSGVNLRFFTSIISGRELPATHWMPLPAAPQQEA
ncbi:DUF551 domain-containing protein [Enterobacter asburiae]|uniref:DUF551 domain-containing protein n=1 Tax=Enterobacter asburiae TaxID=61645 RepID=UPI001432A77F|nr:DUF551 domain-containing protein [Enterobacter asburiae]NKD18611.1 DUF551 domain-containing protein [Enterobacter asburiae]